MGREGCGRIAIWAEGPEFESKNWRARAASCGLGPESAVGGRWRSLSVDGPATRSCWRERSPSACLSTWESGFAGAAHSEPEIRLWNDILVVASRDQHNPLAMRGMADTCDYVNASDVAQKVKLRKVRTPLLSTSTTRMLRARLLVGRRPVFRTYATAAGPHALVFLEHTQGVLDSGSLSALSAAQQLGGQVTGLLIGSEESVSKAVDSAKK